MANIWLDKERNRSNKKKMLIKTIRGSKMIRWMARQEAGEIEWVNTKRNSLFATTLIVLCRHWLYEAQSYLVRAAALARRAVSSFVSFFVLSLDIFLSTWILAFDLSSRKAKEKERERERERERNSLFIIRHSIRCSNERRVNEIHDANHVLCNIIITK